MRGRVFLTAAYHRDTGALSDEDAHEAAQRWTYRGEIGPWRFSPDPKRPERSSGLTYPLEGWIKVTNASINHERSGVEDSEQCIDVVLPSHSVRLIEVDDG